MNGPIQVSAAPRGLRALEHAGLILVTAIAGLELFGWWLPALGAHLPHGWGLMKANTAAGFLLATASLWLSAPDRSPQKIWLSRASGALLLLLASITLIEYLRGGIAGFDTLLVAGSSRTSLQTACGFLLLGVQLLCLRADRHAFDVVADVCAFALIALVLLLLSGYVYGARELFGMSSLTPTSPQSVLCLVLLTPLAVMRRAARGVFAPLVNEDIGGRVARVAIPAAIAVIYATGFLYQYLTLNGLLTQAYAVAFSVSALVFVVICLTLLMSRLIDSFEQRLRDAMEVHAQDKVRESERRYAELVEQSITGFVMRDARGQLLLVNDAYCRMTGYTREELLHLSAKDMVVDQAVLAKVGLLKPGESTTIETLMKCKGGALREVQYVTQRRDDGNLQSVLLDVSERKQAQRARAESERRYTELVEQAPDSIWLRDSSGTMVFVNEAACKLLGYPREELLGSHSQQLIHAADPGTTAQIDALKPLQTLRMERVMRHKDGHPIPVEASAHRLADGSVQIISHDISDRRLIEEARAESERRYAELVDQALEGIMVREASGDLIFVNDAFCRMLGYGREELLALRITDLVHPEDAGTIAHVASLELGAHIHIEKRMLRKDGGTIYVEVSAKRLRSGDIQTTVQNVTERKQSETRFRSMVEGAPNAMIMADTRGIITLVNTQAEQLFGYSRDELIGQPVEMLVPGQLRGAHPAHREGYNRDPQMRSMGAGRDLFGLRKDGREVPVEIGLNPIATAEGRFVLASVIDITERKLAEEREHTHAEELRRMSGRLSEAQETERRAIARELHDEVGQSLTATRLNLRDLEQEAAGGPLAQRLGDASSIVAELLGKVRQMSLDLHPSVLDDLGLVPALRWCVRTRAANSGVEVTFDVPEDLPRFDGMAEITLFRVFQESLSNVLKHAGAKSLRVTLRHADGRLELDVQDDGHGFDAKAARREALSGKSLGLIGMQERVRLAGGEITITSSKGGGALVHVDLPAMGRHMDME